jgi:hypothetical protein
VKRPRVDFRSDLFTEKRRDPLDHLGGGFVGKGKQKYLAGFDPLPQQKPNPPNDSRGFPRPRRSDNKVLAVGRCSGKILFFV